MGETTIYVGEAMVVVSLLAAPSYIIRVHERPDIPYRQFTVGTLSEDGSEIFLSGWIDHPLLVLSREQWKLVKAASFPDVQWVVWEHRTPEGSVIKRVRV